jgi:uncharacterized membrane protein YraQ (UPF0718 family)
MPGKIRKIVLAGLSGGIVLLIGVFIADAIAQLVAPYTITELGGMRTVQDPVMMLFFFYPVIFGLIAAVVWDAIRPAFTGTDLQKALQYAGILFILVVIPNTIVIWTSMTYPIGFHLSNILAGLICYPVIGYVNVRFN